MIQILYLIKTMALLACISLFWMGMIWFLRTRRPDIRDLTILSVFYAVKLLVHISIYVMYYAGAGLFLQSLYVVDILDIFLSIGVSVAYISCLENMSKGQELKLHSAMKYIAAVVLSIVLVTPRILIHLNLLTTSNLILSQRAGSVIVAVLLAASIFIVVRNRLYRNSASRLDRQIWYILLGLGIVMPLANLLDYFFSFGYWIQTSKVVFPTRVFSSAALIFIGFPMVLTMLSLLNQLRSILAFMDVDRALLFVEKKISVTSGQQEILRYFFDRGWSDTLQFYGMFHVRSSLAPVLKGLGYRTLIELLHDVQRDQADSVRHL